MSHKLSAVLTVTTYHNYAKYVLTENLELITLLVFHVIGTQLVCVCERERELKYQRLLQCTQWVLSVFLCSC